MIVTAVPPPHHGLSHDDLDLPSRSGTNRDDLCGDDGNDGGNDALPNSRTRTRAGTWAADSETVAAPATSSAGRTNRVRADTWSGLGRRGIVDGSGSGRGRIRLRIIDRSHSMSSPRPGEVIAEGELHHDAGLAHSASFNSLQTHLSFQRDGDASVGGSSRDDDEFGSGCDDDDSTVSCHSHPFAPQRLTPIASRQQTKQPQLRSVPQRSRMQGLSEGGRRSANGTAKVDTRLSLLREHRQLEIPKSAPNARRSWQNEENSAVTHNRKAKQEDGTNVALRSRAMSGSSADVARALNFNRRSHSMEINDTCGPDELGIAHLNDSPSITSPVAASSSVDDSLNGSVDLSSVACDHGGAPSADGGSPMQHLTQEQFCEITAPVLKPYKTSSDVLSSRDYPIPPWMTSKGTNEEDDDGEMFSIGAVGDQARRSRSITFAAASAAPIRRMASKVRRSQSVEILDRDQHLTDNDGSVEVTRRSNKEDGVSMRRGLLRTVSGSPDSVHAKHCDYVYDSSGRSDLSVEGASSDNFDSNVCHLKRKNDKADTGFENSHDLLFENERKVNRDDSSSISPPASPFQDEASDSPNSSIGRGRLSRWRMRKRRQQQQKSCDQLYDDEGNLVVSATPRAAPPQVHCAAPASDEWRLVLSLPPTTPTLGDPPESNLPALNELANASTAMTDGATSRRLAPTFDGTSHSPSSLSTIPVSNAAPVVAQPASQQRYARGHLAAIADEADSDNLADVATTAAMARAAGDSQRPDAGGEDVPLWKQLIDYFRYRPLKKKILTITVILSVVLVIIDFATLELIRGWMEGFLRWMQHHPTGGFFAFIALFITTTLVFIPPSILTFGAGFVFSKAFGLGPGVLIATFSCFLGASSGAVIAFFRARYMMRDLVKLFANRYPIVKAADAALKRKGFRIMVLLRLCPLIPFNALNYIGGVTGVRWEHYTFALVGLLPFMVTTIFLGATAGTVSNKKAGEDKITNIVSIVVGCTVSVLAVVLIWHFARKELHREIAAHQEMEINTESPESVDDLEESRHSQANNEDSDISLAASLGDSFADFGQQNADDRYQEEWYWLWT